MAGFWRNVDRSGGDAACWPWIGRRFKHGYGVVPAADRSGLHTTRAPRVAWFLATGDDPGSLCVCHRCDNPPCCNPAHLFLGAQRDNVADMIKKGRRADNWSGEKNCTAKLDRVSVECLRVAYATGVFDQKQLAKRWGVSQTNVSAIVRSETWR